MPRATYAPCGPLGRSVCVCLLTVAPLLCSTGILYHDMYAHDLVGAHVEMRSLEVGRLALCWLQAWTALIWMW